MISEAMEDYLKAIYTLGHAGPAGAVKTGSLAEALGSTAPSVTRMCKKLARLGLVKHQPRRGATLMRDGERIALRVLRRHRLLEPYLVEALGLPWDRVGAEADRREHVVSDKLEARLDAALGYPTRDPHGDPIPALDGSIDDPAWRRLGDVPADGQARVVRVPDRDPRLLRDLAEIGLVPAADVSVVRREPLDGPLPVRAGDAQQQHVINRDIAGRISVSTLA